MNASGYLRPLLNAVLGVAVVLLFWLTVWPVALEVARRYPLETLIIGGVVAVCAAAVILYIWELVIIGWIVDLLFNDRRAEIPGPARSLWSANWWARSSSSRCATIFRAFCSARRSRSN